MKASSESGLWATRISFFVPKRLPDLSREVILRHFQKHGFVGVPHAVVDETNVGAPAPITRDLFCFGFAFRRFPEHIELHVDFAQLGYRLAELTRAHATVEVDNSGSLTRRTGHAPLVAA